MNNRVPAQQRFFDLPVIAETPIDPQTQVFKYEAFPASGPLPWLDAPDAQQKIAVRLRDGEITGQQAEWCRKWVEDGYLIIERFFDEKQLDATWSAYEMAIETGMLKPPVEPLFDDDSLPGRTLNPHFAVDEIRAMLFDERMNEVVSLLLGAKAAPFQTIGGHKSSEQLQHSDSIHMSTYPNGYLVANWIAFEDIHPDSGPLVFHPGSHRLPYLMSEALGMPFGCGYSAYHDIYEPAIQKTIADHALEAHYFLPKKGDVLLWHANLLHGGSKMKDPAHVSRKALVCHFFSQGCLCYHDLTGMPSTLTPLEFDANAYLEANPDVRASGGNALQHYVYYGRFEGRPMRLPQPHEAVVPPELVALGFDTVLYLEANPDVAAAGVDPVAHYLEYGRAENRRIRP
ncbi:phytanoyl-CoA dioxygenase family protein [Paraburkholderia ginsengisoli]|uniref:Phytanoyl-CoA dioxygenase family protein n=1 Tax=Paraburkholderia ginsengisoli TaxID=311231 RepID=A0A7T4N2T2_9BURK|nr:phytanoyl-CoA dioxygenase family protein [Paraburkholderia ginsengisoli]QQC64177.1 phytanoyl-CoA dioxygenase family protein [Paraburkholderia ginsengisoli]